MKLMQAVKMAFSAIFSNRMRSFLTMLGVIIGVFAVAVLVSVMEGATNSVTDQMQGLGSTQISAQILGGRYKLTLADLKEIEELDYVIGVSTDLSSTMKAKNGATTYDVNVVASTASFTLVQNRTVETGRFFAQHDVDQRAAVAVLGSKAAVGLFGSAEDVIGKEIAIAGKPFTIIGVLEDKGSTIMGDADDMIVIPISVGQRLVGSTSIRSLTIVATSDAEVGQAQLAVEKYLDRKLGKTSDDRDTYRIYAQSQILDSISTITGMMTGLLAGIAAISLLVGGIGIMNIMLVSVTERTREIGIRKAIGARRRDILIQFLVEAMAITLLGGIIGLILGQLGTMLVANLIDITAQVTPEIIALSLGFSLFVGVVFGLYPAAKAANLQPIDALRHD